MSQEIDPPRPQFFVITIHSDSVCGCDVAVVSPVVMMVVSSFEMTTVDVRRPVFGPWFSVIKPWCLLIGWRFWRGCWWCLVVVVVV